MLKSRGTSRWNIQASWVGPSAWLHAELPTIGTRVRWALRPVGWATQCSLSVGLNFCAMKPSSPAVTLRWRSSWGRFSRTVVPRVPPGTSSAPTRVASTVRAQQHSKAPQPLFTDLPRVTATGRSGRVAPSTSMVAPICAFSRYSPAMRRMVAAGTSLMPSAHSGVYLRMCSTSIVWAGTPSTSASGWRASSASTVTAAATRKRPSSAGWTPGVSKGMARPAAGSHTSGLAVSGSRR